MTDDGGSDPTESDDENGSWWSIEGETTGERVRNGFPQLAIVVVLVWVGTSVAYNVFSAAFDPLTARASIVLGALYVGLRLRRWLLVDEASDGDEELDENARDAAENGDATSDGDESDALAEENGAVTEESDSADDDAAPGGDAAAN